jgi:hypothetical protein
LAGGAGQLHPSAINPYELSAHQPPKQAYPALGRTFFCIARPGCLHTSSPRRRPFIRLSLPFVPNSWRLRVGTRASHKGRGFQVVLFLRQFLSLFVQRALPSNYSSLVVAREQKPKMVFYNRKITVSDDTVTSAVHLTLRQSIIPCLLGESRPDLTLTAWLISLRSHHPLLPLVRRIAHRSERLPLTSFSGASPMACLMSSTPIFRRPLISRPPEHRVSLLPALAPISSVLRRLVGSSSGMGFPRNVHVGTLHPRRGMSPHVAQWSEALLRRLLR